MHPFGTTFKLLFAIVFVPIVVKGSICNVKNATVDESPSDISAKGSKNETPFDPYPYPTTGRLPTWIYPSHYALSLSAYLDNATYNGSVTIDVKVVNNTDKIVLSAVDLIMINETSKVLNLYNKTEEISIKNQTYDAYLQFYIIHLNQVLQAGNLYQIHVAFRGTLNNKLVGFYLSSYKDSNGNDVHVASTQFSPTDARRAFPCFDEPDFKATFDISIERDGSVKALSNMPIASTSAAEWAENRFVDQFETTLKMSTYLVGFLLSDFSYKSSNVLNDTQFKVWSRVEALDQIDYSLKVGPKILLFLEDYFGTKYLLPKLDMAAIPNFKFSGMENWGLIMFRESALLYDETVTTVDRKRSLISVLAHEIAHMWFGNLVTPKWWSELWLKEGFANFMGYLAIDNIEPEWKMMDNSMVGGSMKAALALDSLKTSHPINVEVNHPDRISEIFDAISYNKGASIIRMMYHFLSDKVYKRGMQNYVKGLQYSNAVQDDLWRYLTEAWKETKSFDPERTVETIMNTWTLQQGFPVVNVQRNCNQVMLTQKRFLLQENSADNTSMGCEPDEKWWIPISFTDENTLNFNNTQPAIWLQPAEQVATLQGLSNDSNNWFILNIQKTGFYRVNYDINNWQLLLKQLLSNHSVIHHLNREQVLDDAFILAKAGYIHYSLPIRMGKYMKNETNPIAWSTFLSNYDYIYKMAKTTKQIEPFNKYLQEQIIPLYELTGFMDSPEDSYDLQNLRIQATTWACDTDYEPCLLNARKLFQQWLELPKNESSHIITNNIKQIVLCNGIKNATYEEWSKTFEVYLSSNVQSEKSEILLALGCSQDSEILSRFLDMSLNSSSGILKQDTSTVFSGVSQSILGASLAWEKVKSSWSFLINYLGSGSALLWTIFQAPTTYFNSQEDITQIEEFLVREKDNLGSVSRTIDQSLEKVKINMKWMESYFPIVSKSIEKKDN